MQHLTKLITAMSKQEKANFSNLHREDKDRNFYKIYKAILANPKVSVETLGKRFQDIPQLSYELNNLYNKLLRSLQIGKLNSSDPKTKMRNLLRTSEILQEKGSVKESLKALRKAKLIAKRLENFQYLFVILEQEKSLLFANATSDIEERMQASHNEVSVVAQQYADLRELSSIARKLIRIQYHEGIGLASDSLPPELQNNPILNGEVEVNGVGPNFMAHFTRSIRAITIGDTAVGYEEAVSAYELMIRHPDIYGMRSRLSVINNILMACIYGLQKDHFNEWLGKLKQLEVDKPSLKRLASYYSLISQGHYYSLSLDFDGFQVYMDSTLDFISANKGTLNKTQSDSLRLTIIYDLLLQRRYDSAHRMLAEWQVVPVPDYLRQLVRKVSIGVHLGLQNHSLIERELAAFKRTYRHEDKANPVFDTFIHYVQTQLSTGEGKKQLKVLNETNTKFQQQFADRHLRKHFMRFNFLNWFECCEFEGLDLSRKKRKAITS